MSGPKVAIYVPPAEPVTALVAAAAIHAAAAVAEGYAQASALAATQQAERAALGAEQVAAAAAGLAAIEREAAAAEAHFAKLLELGGRLGIADQLAASRPLRPQAPDVATLAAYVRGLRALTDELQTVLLTESALQTEALAGDAEQIALPEPAAGVTPRVRRLLARIAHLGELPAGIAEVADELDRSPPGQRADLLASELRRRIQAHLDASRQAMLQRAMATIVDSSLKDLGYQVETIAETLFVEGGVVHFRRPGWGDYMVRLRVDPRATTVNFNVVRAVEAGNNERSVLDHLAEDRWCAEFPALLRALEAHGVALQVTRHLAPGELPVQLVERGRLPRFADEAIGTASVRPLAKEIK